jgi:hypothetical protein
VHSRAECNLLTLARKVRDTDGLKQCNEGQRTASLCGSESVVVVDKRKLKIPGPECCALPDGAVGTYFHSICLKNSLSSSAI